MKRVDFLPKLARALAAKNKVHAHRKQRRHATLQELASDPALLGHFMPDDTHRIGTRRDVIDGADDRRSASLVIPAATREHGLSRFLHPLENTIQHRDVKLFLGGEMMQ